MDFDDIIQYLDQIMSSIGRFISFIKDDFSLLLMPKINVLDDSHKKFIAAMLGMSIKFLHIVAPHFAQSLTTMWTSQPTEYRLQEYLHLIPNVMSYSTIKILDLALKVLSDANYTTELIEVMGISDNELYTSELNILRYNIYYRIDLSIYIYFNLELAKNHTNPKIKSLYNYIAQQINMNIINI